MNAPELLPVPARYALARDRAQWDGAIAALEPDADGHLTLARLPGPADGLDVDLAPPYDLGVSGIAAGPCGVVFVADTAKHQIVFVDRRCRQRATVPMPGSHGITDPTGVAVDSAGNRYVLDEAGAAIARFDEHGWPDAAYNATLAAQPQLTAPRFLAVGEGDVLLVTDASAKAVFVFASDGTFSHELPAPPGGGWTPGAIACHGRRAFVHDTVTGRIHLFSLPAPAAPGPAAYAFVSTLPGFRGPVTALACDADGHLLIKTGLDDAFVVFVAGMAHAASGTIEIGPLDAGVDLEWFRAVVDADVPLRTRATLEVAQLDPPAPPPTAADWIAAPALDTLLAPLVAPVPPPSRRWLWLRVTLSTGDPRVTPTLRQLRAETPGEDYLDYLPAVYRRTDAGGQLFRLLALAKTEQGAVDERVDDMPRVASPAFARTSSLPWLAEWVAFELPAAAGEDERRALIASAIARHERRGTPASIRQFVELHTGIRPAIVEAYTTRAVWILGESSRLGFDTALPGSHPDGVIVPDSSVTTDEPPRCCPPPIGSAVVGESGPLPRDRFGEPLYSDTAHRFHVVVPAHQTRDAALVDEVRRILDREKPAHTQYCLCVVPPRISVGFQAQIGVDMVIGGGRPAFRLDESALGLAAIGPKDSAGRIGMNARVGETTQLS